LVATGTDSQTPSLEPAIVLVARPVYEGLIANNYRLYLHEASSWKKCTVGGILTDVRKGSRVYFRDQVIPPDFSGVRFKLRCWSDGGVFLVRADSETGPMLCAGVVRRSSFNEETGEPEWQVRCA
jgi:hypothetical protein